VEFIKIVLLAVLAAVAYGIVHDQITARVCVEYFTVAHPRVFDTDSPTLLGLGWGVIATWWAGFIFGLPAAALARWGKAPKLAAKELLGPIGVLLGVMGFCALVAGIAGYVLARQGVITLGEPLASQVPAAKHVALLADAAAHLASYACGFLGGLVLCLWIWWQRRLRAAHDRANAAMAAALKAGKTKRA